MSSYEETLSAIDDALNGATMTNDEDIPDGMRWVPESDRDEVDQYGPAYGVEADVGSGSFYDRVLHADAMGAMRFAWDRMDLTIAPGRLSILEDDGSSTDVGTVSGSGRFSQHVGHGSIHCAGPRCQMCQIFAGVDYLHAQYALNFARRFGAEVSGGSYARQQITWHGQGLPQLLIDDEALSSRWRTISGVHQFDFKGRLRTWLEPQWPAPSSSIWYRPAVTAPKASTIVDVCLDLFATNDIHPWPTTAVKARPPRDFFHLNEPTPWVGPRIGAR